MAFTGLLILFYLVLPWGLSEQYGKAGIPKFYNEMQFTEVAKPRDPSLTEAMQPLINSWHKCLSEQNLELF